MGISTYGQTHARYGYPDPMRIVKRRYFSLAACLGAAILACGCGRHSTQTASTPADSSSADTTAFSETNPPGPPPGEPVQVNSASPTDTAEPAPAAMTPDQITLALHHWIGRHQRLPKDFDEFAASSRPPIPPPPPGKKYIINSSWQVVLVNR